MMLVKVTSTRRCTCVVNVMCSNFAPTPKRASPPRLVKEPPQRRSPSSDRFQAPSPAKDHIEQSIKRAPTPDHAAALTERPVREAAPARYTSAPDSLPHSDVSQVVNNRTDYPDDRPSTSRPFTSIARSVPICHLIIVTLFDSVRICV